MVSYLKNQQYNLILDYATTNPIDPIVHLKALWGLGKFKEFRELIARIDPDFENFSPLNQAEFVLQKIKAILYIDQEDSRFENLYLLLEELGGSIGGSYSEELLIEAKVFHAEFLLQSYQPSSALQELETCNQFPFETYIHYRPKICNYKSVAHRHLDNIDAALTLAHEALSYLTHNPDDEVFSSIYNNLGNAYIYKGDLQQALYYHKEALLHHQNSGDLQAIASSHNNIGSIFNELGSHFDALTAFQKALSIDEEIDDIYAMAISLSNIGNTYRLMGRYNDAEEFLRQALEIETTLGNSHGMALVSLNLVKVMLFQGRVKLAMEYIENSGEFIEGVGSEMDQRDLLLRRGRLHYMMNQYNLAWDYLYQAFLLSEQSNNPMSLSESLLWIYHLRSSLGDKKLNIDNYLIQKLENSLASINFSTSVFLQVRKYIIDLLKLKLEHQYSFDKASHIIQQFEQLPVVDFEYHRLVLLIKTDLLVRNISTNGDMSIINVTLDELTSLAETHNSISLHIEVYMLRIKVAIYEKDIETVNAYFNLAKSLAKENDLQLLLEFVQTEILNYTSMLSHTPLYEESVSLIEDPDPLGILAFIEAIINRQLEYLVLGAVQHRYSDEIPLCGDPRPFSEGLFCPKCRQLGLQKDIRMIVQRYLASTICSYCYYQVTNQQINDVISSYLASNPRGIYNPFLEITSPFFEGIIQWACPNPSCQNPDLFQFNLNEINHLFL